MRQFIQFILVDPGYHYLIPCVAIGVVLLPLLFLLIFVIVKMKKKQIITNNNNQGN